MRQWERVAYRERCGQCGKLLAKNDPVLAITPSGVQRTLWRCGECAGPVPPDLPERVETESIDAKIERLRSFATIDTVQQARREWLPHPND